ncbi:MAG TPA: DMT family transporter [Blastocatellia bacterium]|nr:DMT family transporter [Blastocatellia bacterium]HMV84651.1 DMT family transporter [Blastocatellia bacterium]HMX29871.1 DMT family transporter [Blastocatellia bacterium]HMY71045.1 DMT family transporter [Blastocatellia bacterium]HMZ18735.1 DMT family transporter [Blastocatellia bacterium]
MNNITSNQQPAGRLSDAALIALALMWGTSHVITKSILATHSPAFYTSARFGIAALCFGLAFAGHLRRSSLRHIKQGALLGLLSFTGIACYVLGLNFTQASKAGFITGLYLVFTPLLGFVLFRSKPTRDHLAGLIVAVAGFVLLSVPHGKETINWGDVLVLTAAVAWATHIAATSAFAAGGDVRTLAAVQVMIVAVLGLTTFFILKSLGMETRPNPIDGQFLRQILYMAVMVTFVAALVQTWAQGRVNPTHAVIFYALEPATAAIFAYLSFGEKLTLQSGIGAALIVAGVMISRLRLTSRLTNHKTLESVQLEADC